MDSAGLFMSLLPELRSLEQMFCYKRVAPHGASRAVVAVVVSTTEPKSRCSPRRAPLQWPSHPFPSCTEQELALTVPPPMGLSLGKSIFLCLCLTVFLVCSCEKHDPGEYPEVQRDLT